MASSLPTVDVQHVFGSHCSAGIVGSALFADDSGHHALYPVGRRIAIRHIESQEVTFLGGLGSSSASRGPEHAPDDFATTSMGLATSSIGGTSSTGGDESADSVAFCCASRERTFLATGERRSREPFNAVAVYDLPALGGTGPLKVLECFKGRGAKLRLVAGAFSSDGDARFLAVLSTGAEPMLTVLDWRGESVLARLKLEDVADRVAWSTQAGGCQISVSGPHLMRIVVLKDALSKIRESSLKPSAPFKGLDETNGRIVDHAWVEPGGEPMIVACTHEGRIYVLDAETLAVTATLKQPFGERRSGASPVCLRCYSSGFVVGGTEGMVAVWEKDDDGSEGLTFKFLRGSRIARSKAAVVSIDTSGTEESLVFGFRSGDVGSMPFSNLVAESSSGEAFCSTFAGGYHAGPIASLDIAAHRPVAVSVGRKDGLLRIWNYSTRQCDICWQSEANDAPVVAAVHPFGYFVAAGFTSKVRLFYVLAKGLQQHAEFSVSGTKLLRFSNGGHLLVVVQGKFAHIFSTRTMTKTITLHGHAHSINAVCFDPEDTTLWTCGSDGQLCAWDPLSGERLGESASLRCEYLAAASGHNGQVVCSLLNGGKTSLLRVKGTNKDLEEEMAKDLRISSLCYFPFSSYLFAASAAGKVYVYSAQHDLVLDVGLHSAACTAICISADGRTALTAGDDGAIFVLSVTGLATAAAGEEGSLAATGGSTVGAGAAAATDGAMAASAAEAVLVQRALLQKRLEQCRKLRAENRALKGSLEDERRRLEAECQAKLAEARQKDQAEIQELKRRKEAIDRSAQKKQRNSDWIMKSMVSSHTQAAEQLGGLSEKKVIFEKERYGDLEAEQARLEAQIEEAQEQLARQLEELEDEARADLERDLEERKLEIQKHTDLIAFYQVHFNKLLDEEATSSHVEVLDLSLQAQRQLKEQKVIEETLRAEQAELLSGLEIMEEEKVSREKEQQETSVVIRTLREQKDELTRTRRSLEAEKAERQATLEEKDKKVAGYKVKVNELKKFRHKLNKELQEVTESLQPKEQTIGQLHGNLQELESELEKQLLEQRAMEQELAQKKQHLSQLAQESKDLKEVIDQKDRLITRYTYDLHSIIHSGEEERAWPQEIRRMYHAYVCEDKAGEDRIPLESMQRQMKQVERRVASLAVKSGQMRAKCKTDIQRKAQENAQLVNDVNILRKEKQALQSSCRALQKRLEELEGRMVIADSPPPAAAAALASTAPGLAVAERTPRPTSSRAAALPRVPSGSLPGPRQQQSAATGASAARRTARTRSVPPLGHQAPEVRARASEQDVVRMQAIMQTAQSLGASPELFKSESAKLREKIDALTRARPSSDLGGRRVTGRPSIVDEG